MWGLDRTGGVRVLFEIANRMTERGHDVSFTTLGRRNSPAWFPLKTSKIIYAEESSMRQSSLSSILNDASSFIPNKILQNLKSWVPHNYLRASAIKLLADNVPPNTDINVATFCFSAFSVCRSGIGIPFNYLQHYEPIFFDDVYTKRWVEKTYLLPLNRIANSSWLKTLLTEKFGVDSYGPVVPGVEHEVFYHRNIEKNCSEKLVVGLGKSLRWKGLQELFEALMVVQKSVPNVKLVLFGSEPYLKDASPVPCDYLVKISDAQLAELYSMADVVVTPSWYESSPLPPLEAMACGAPIITTKYGTEDYCYHEKNCLVVPPKDSKSLSKAILTLLRSDPLRERFSREGLKTAKQFTWERTTNKVEKIFKESLSKS